jgi:hypothetical protein
MFNPLHIPYQEPRGSSWHCVLDYVSVAATHQLIEVKIVEESPLNT